VYTTGTMDGNRYVSRVSCVSLSLNLGHWQRRTLMFRNIAILASLAISFAAVSAHALTTDGDPYSSGTTTWGYQFWDWNNSNDLILDFRATPLRFRCGASTERADTRYFMYVNTSTGNISLSSDGSTPPSPTDATTKLYVKGNTAIAGILSAEEVKVTSTGFPDFVFGPSYKLLSLKEVESQIKKDGHLPGVPSAKEVEKNGLSIGEMSNTQMKKIEELTLYVIQLQKENDALKNELNKKNEDLQKRLEALEAQSAQKK
jgi:hypothetical protein